MIDLAPAIKRIEALLAENTNSSITYAALEARIALERFVYDRLRQRHDYISHAQLRAWTPGDVIKRLLTEVDTHATETIILSVSSASDDTLDEVDDNHWIHLGTEVGFDSKQISKMWQALSGLALHVRLPKDRQDSIPEYGNKELTRSKVEEVVIELKRLSTGTMTFSGIPEGGDVNFTCSCGQTNKRRANLLTIGQYIYCFNPQCKQTWKVTSIEGKDVEFENVFVDVVCQSCKYENSIPWRVVTGMRYDEMLKFPCADCKTLNYCRWHLTQVAPKSSADTPSKNSEP